MGHYYSEMVSFEEQEEIERLREELRKSRTEKIEKLIEEKGIARVLAEMIEDPILFKIHTR
jgi:hypothetical protein